VLAVRRVSFLILLDDNGFCIIMSYQLIAKLYNRASSVLIPAYKIVSVISRFGKGLCPGAIASSFMEPHFLGVI